MGKTLWCLYLNCQLMQSAACSGNASWLLAALAASTLAS